MLKCRQKVSMNTSTEVYTERELNHKFEVSGIYSTYLSEVENVSL